MRSAPARVDSAVLLTAAVAATLMRFVVLRVWLTPGRRLRGARRATAQPL